MTMATSGEKTLAGEAVQIQATDYTEKLDAAGRSGLVIDARKSHVCVLLLEDERAVWVPPQLVRRYVPGSIPRSHPLGFVLRVLALFPDAGAPEVKLAAAGSSSAADGNRITIPHGAMDLAAIDRVREFVGGDLVSMTLAPGGMRRLSTTIVWKSA